jgi:Protein of unknown function (DUF3592)
MKTNWVGWVFSGIVLLLLFFVGAILANPVRLLITGEKAEGVVVGMAESGSLQAPIFEFVTSTGSRVSVKGRSYSAWNSAQVGDAVTIAYAPSYPRDAQLLVLSEFCAAGFMLGFTGLVLLSWISFILVLKDPAYGDPFQILPAVISHFRLNPVRFPLFFMLSVIIPSCGGATYFLFNDAQDLRSYGIKAAGHVIGSQRESSRLSDGSSASGVFPMIAYEDASGTAYTIRRSLARPLSRLQTGEIVEVIYPARHPGKGVVNVWDELYLVPLFFGSMTLAFLVLFLLVMSGSIAPSKSEPGSHRKL